LQAITDLVGGTVEVFMSSVPTAISQLKGGKMRALAVMSAKRSISLPDVPSINEAGYKGFDANPWFGHRAHHTINGSNLQPGDLFGSGTLSGPTFDQAAALVEFTVGGKQPLQLPSGEARTYLQDGDAIVLRG
jgi:hypothetical protein